jgi:hypothetical protein
MLTTPLRPVLLVLASLLLLASWPAIAANSYKMAVDAGVTELEIDGVTLRVETTAEVVLYLQFSEGDITGTVESSGATANVTIILLGPPDEVIFRGRVGRGTIFAEYFPQETGQGEM